MHRMVQQDSMAQKALLFSNVSINRMYEHTICKARQHTRWSVSMALHDSMRAACILLMLYASSSAHA